MRTTLTLDDDVAVRLEELRRQTGAPIKDLVNRALRAGFEQLERGEPKRRRFRTRPVSAGRCLVPSLDDITAVLDLVEGESFR